MTNKYPDKSIDRFAAYQKIHIIGIGGIGVSALARILKKYNHRVSGSDFSPSKNLELLAEEGMEIFHQHSETNLANDTDLVIYTIAIGPDNPELLKARDLGIKCLTYPQAVGLLTQSLRTISVAGTHGKTTTTAMAGLALQNNQTDPSVIVGALLNNFDGKNYLAGLSDLLVLESCEYRDSFLNYYPEIVLLTNVEIDHHDYFANEEKYIRSFHDFISRIPETGILIANIDDHNIRKLLEHNWPFKKITFGQSPQADYQIKDHQIVTPKQDHLKFKLQIPGLHNVYNSAAVLALSDALNLNQSKTLEALENFSGAARRFEKKGYLGKTLIIDDYGHHPTELLATFNSCREILQPDQTFLCVFQPHQYSRTLHLLDDFIEVLGRADAVYIPNIYEARDTAEDKQKISASKLVDLINKKFPGKAVHTKNLQNTAELIKQNYQNFALILTQGAGDITTLGNLLIR